jgi:hypothetical protein
VCYLINVVGQNPFNTDSSGLSKEPAGRTTWGMVIARNPFSTVRSVCTWYQDIPGQAIPQNAKQESHIQILYAATDGKMGRKYLLRRAASLAGRISCVCRLECRRDATATRIAARAAPLRACPSSAKPGFEGAKVTTLEIPGRSTPRGEGR